MPAAADDTLEPAAIAWLEADLAPRAMVDRALRILWLNQPAGFLIASAQEVERRDGRLAAVDRTRDAALRDFVAAATPKLSTLSLPRADAKGVLLLRALRPAGSAVCGLTLLRTGPGATVEYQGLREAFDLTPAEHRVLLALLDGSAAEAIATGQAVSLDTIRSHIRGIYAKLAVNSREQLFSLVRAFRV